LIGSIPQVERQQDPDVDGKPDDQGGGGLGTIWRISIGSNLQTQLLKNFVSISR
jgi:hypothetical protein